MAIIGISDRRRLPRQGKIKIGEKIEKVNQYGKTVEYPVALDHFKVPEEVQAIYGTDPKEIDIIFPVNDMEQIFPQYMKKYGKTGLHCKGDGETGTAMINEEMVERECNPTEDPWCKGCQPKGTLSYIVPKVSSMRVYQTTTGGWNSIVNINSSLDMIRGMTGGKIAFIPLKLKLEPHEGTVTKDGKQFKKTVYVLQVDIDGTMEDFITRFQRKALAPSEDVLQIQSLGQGFIDMLSRDKEKQLAGQGNVIEVDNKEPAQNADPPAGPDSKEPAQGTEKPPEPVDWPKFWGSVKGNMHFTEDDVHIIASALSGTTVTSIADWTRDEVTVLYKKIQEIYKEDQAILKQMEVDAANAAVNPLVKELTELWQQAGRDVNGSTIQKYLENRFKKTVAEITEEEWKPVIAEAKKYLADKNVS